jgi:hypothetical protein
MALERPRKVGTDAVSGYPTSAPMPPPFLGTTGAGKGILDGEMYIEYYGHKMGLMDILSLVTP